MSLMPESSFSSTLGLAEQLSGQDCKETEIRRQPRGQFPPNAPDHQILGLLYDKVMTNIMSIKATPDFCRSWFVLNNSYYPGLDPSSFSWQILLWAGLLGIPTSEILSI